MIYIKMVSPGPIFFKQKRVGYRGRHFTLYKFRTMKHQNNEDIHKAHAATFIRENKSMNKLDMAGDSRIIKGGRFIRVACLDEIPQLINVFLGEMSIVGPRPCIPYEESEYDHWQRQRFNILPGLTGLWQVSGKNKLSFHQMIRLDIQYANNFSFWLDLKIIFLTVPAIISMIIDALMAKIRR